ncbi:MAG TPA: prepilin-type cleavage/methylation domain-containing protein [Lachnospiraceae bacterium]|nr:prepilin-type cleavage/methylation domain-containing protein [Lachnospiraceae bacterium]
MRKLREMTQKRMGNKGFSLVELIIVVAIMAVLVGILAPQYLKYVERSRVAADDAIAEQIKSGVSVLLTDDDYKEVKSSFTVTWTGAGTNPDTVTIAGPSGAELTAIEKGLDEYLGLGFGTTATAHKDMKAKGHVPSDETPNPAAASTAAGYADATTYTVTVTANGGIGTVTSAAWTD